MNVYRLAPSTFVVDLGAVRVGQGPADVAREVLHVERRLRLQQAVDRADQRRSGRRWPRSSRRRRPRAKARSVSRWSMRACCDSSSQWLLKMCLVNGSSVAVVLEAGEVVELGEPLDGRGQQQHGPRLLAPARRAPRPARPARGPAGSRRRASTRPRTSRKSAMCLTSSAAKLVSASKAARSASSKSWARPDHLGRDELLDVAEQVRVGAHLHVGQLDLLRRASRQRDAARAGQPRRQPAARRSNARPPTTRRSASSPGRSSRRHSR